MAWEIFFHVLYIWAVMAIGVRFGRWMVAKEQREAKEAD